MRIVSSVKQRAMKACYSRYFRLSLLSLLLLVLACSCEKEEGEGGKCSVYGKVLVKDYNAAFTVLKEEYYGPGIWVYIVYGDDRDYSERIQTGYDGTYEFKYLRPGDYTVYALSKDSTLQTNAQVPVIQQVNVPKDKKEVEVPDLIIFD